mmetsp:Transcript_2759/g.3971  ORF Transcript_2759/g.3971 Transcript_2759/m.3971 type:complete len:1021 (+) Transcript_2759:96-3158(+)
MRQMRIKGQGKRMMKIILGETKKGTTTTITQNYSKKQEKKTKENKKGNFKLSTGHESFLSGTNTTYLEEEYRKFKMDPEALTHEWRNYFNEIEKTEMMGTEQYIETPEPIIERGSGAAKPSELSRKEIQTQLKVLQTAISLINSFQIAGHRNAKLDPLGIKKPELRAHLDINEYGVSEEEMDIEFYLPGAVMTEGLLASEELTTLKKLNKKLLEIYCGTIGYEFRHLYYRKQVNWLRNRIETESLVPYTKSEKELIYQRLLYSDKFEEWISQKKPNAKKFGLEGAEALIPGLKAMVDRGAMLGVESIVMGMPHRGRLNVLVNVCRKPFENVFYEFSPVEHDDEEDSEKDFATGDVKYHLGISMRRKLSNMDKYMNYSLLPNPSHLEAVNPLVEGKTRAKQFYSGDVDREKNVAILLHGDAAFAGQGVVYETMGFADLDDYTTGGTIHVVVNNQIGFTTNPSDARSSPYATDAGRFIGAPVFHVNGDDPEAVARVMQLAIEWRQRWKKSVIVDMICYRRNGHNEQDQPFYTQPTMYSVIEKHPTTLTLYKKKLLEEGTLTEEEATSYKESVQKVLSDAYDAAGRGELKYDTDEWYNETSAWAKMLSPTKYSKPQSTGVPLAQLREAGKAISTYPKGFHIHKLLGGIMRRRGKMIDSGENIDWGVGENLAYATLLQSGFNVRISGQDVERGTFSHRHGVITDQKNGKQIRQLDYLDNKRGEFQITNSHLSEYGVLGFELGYAYESPQTLVVWEAQFGDFANCAQVILDTYISNAEDKWCLSSGITLLLPHGMDGAGPEHSSARLERFLQACNGLTNPPSHYQKTVNMFVINPTTPANFFHALRRQMKNNFRKPLIVMSPKILLRHREALSSFDEFLPGTRFQSVLPDCVSPKSSQTRIILCSGKIYYDLVAMRETRSMNDNVAIIRLEELSPFPFADLEKEVTRYLKAGASITSLLWVQEEHENQGAYSYVLPRVSPILRLLNIRQLSYVGRLPLSSSAVGVSKVHKVESERLLNTAFSNLS